jgi:hypothetical protein
MELSKNRARALLPPLEPRRGRAKRRRFCFFFYGEEAADANRGRRSL